MWGPEGILQLRDNKEIQVQTAEEINTLSAQLATKITIPSRSLIVVPSCENKTRFDFTPIQKEYTPRTKLCCIPIGLCVHIGGGATKRTSSVNKFRLSRT